MLTDNRNRTAGEVRATFTKSGGNLAENGAVSFMFDHVGVIEYDAEVANADAMLDAAIEAGADDVISSENGHEIYAHRAHSTARSPRRSRRNSASRASPRWSGSRRTRSRSTTSRARRCCKLLETLNEHDDVQNVYANFEISDALMQKMSA